MTSPSRFTDLQTPPPPPLTAGAEAPQWDERPHPPRPAPKPFRGRFGSTFGFWLGAAVLGAVGCVLGACMPYRHPVAVTISTLWWGIYLGCLGAGVGVLLGLWEARASAPPPRESAGAGTPPGGADGLEPGLTILWRSWNDAKRHPGTHPTGERPAD
jgi:hypothetical protein